VPRKNDKVSTIFTKGTKDKKDEQKKETINHHPIG